MIAHHSALRRSHQPDAPGKPFPISAKPCGAVQGRLQGRSDRSGPRAFEPSRYGCRVCNQRRASGARSHAASEGHSLHCWEGLIQTHTGGAFGCWAILSQRCPALRSCQRKVALERARIDAGSSQQYWSFREDHVLSIIDSRTSALTVFSRLGYAVFRRAGGDLFDFRLAPYFLLHLRSSRAVPLSLTGGGDLRNCF